jgi:hypothetical protein
MGKELQNTTQIITRSFNKGMNKDADSSFIGEGMWSHARNAVNNDVEGNLGTISNESSNYLCMTAGTTMPANVINKYIIGAIQLFAENWLVFTAGHDNTGRPVMSEIGLLNTNECGYFPIVQDACLGFDKRFLITGNAREKEDCTWQAYWADGNNPDRYLNVGDPKVWPTTYTWLGQANINYYTNGTNLILWPGVQWVQKCTQGTDCVICTDQPILDCDKTRLARLMQTPCLNLTLGNQGGTLRNGTYFATIAYSIKGQKVTDYFSQSNTQPVWSPNDLEGSLLLEVSADSENFDEFILVVVQNVNQGTVAKQIGVYSTRTSVIALDQIKEDTISVPLEFLSLQTPVFERSDQIAEVSNYLLRVGPTSKLDFNYQPLANLIKAKWASVEYPSDYYNKGGGKGSYLRDEVYTFFIRWVYDTGDKSASYHIPGRAPRLYNGDFETNNSTDQNALSSDDQVFDVFNTASAAPGGVPSGTIFQDATLVNGKWVLPDGGVVLSTGDMGYWQSTEKYPDNQDYIWNASAHCWTGVPTDPITHLPIPSKEYDLCGLNIRHHKFPDNYLNDTTVHFRKNPNPYTTNALNIRLMGVYFDNIIFPKDNEGNDIQGIVGYEILRGSREGNKSIIAKGMLNNFRSYELKGSDSVTRNRQGLYANYPFNTIRPFYNSTDPLDHNYQFNDPYIKNTDKDGKVLNQSVPMDMVSFHSPDTMFRTPFLSTTELKLYGYLRGGATQQYIEPNNHPEWKLLSDAALIPIFLTGLAEAVISMRGRLTTNSEDYKTPGYGIDPAGVFFLQQTASAALGQGVNAAHNTALSGYFASGGSVADAFAMAFTGTTPILEAIDATYNAGMLPIIGTGGAGVAATTYSYQLPDWAYLDPVSRALGAVNQLIYYFSEGADIALRILYAATPYNQYALQMINYGFYNDMRPGDKNLLSRFKIDDSFYLKNNIQEVPYYQDANNNPHSYSINNLKRSDAVVVRTEAGPYYSGPYTNGVIGPNYITEPSGVGYVDQSLTTIGNIQQNGFVKLDSLIAIGSSGVELPTFEEPEIPFASPIASHYAGLKVRIQNQYGQLQGIKQIVITPCEQKISDYPVETIGPKQCGNPLNYYSQTRIRNTNIFFGGDTFINRYTEKNSMFFFYDWLYGQPNGFEYNYYLHQMIPAPRFWVNSKSFDTTDLINVSATGAAPGTGWTPSKFYNLDFTVNNDRYYNYEDDTIEKNALGDGYAGLFRIKDANFYLAVSSVKDFFVESDVLVDFREQGVYEWEKNYDANRYTDLIRMFDINPESITRGNTYRYDYSFSISKLYNQYFSSGNLQSRYYDPLVANLCYVYYPDRIYYSLQQQNESFKDSWLIYLPNNYKEFTSQISGVKSINKNGIFITFHNDSPLMVQGVDTLQTDLGTKITIGDGGLFSQPGQSVSNADRPYEYASSQNRFSVISTPAGLFWVSRNQGKIFSYGDGLKEISQIGLKWWHTLFLPYKLTVHFYDYPYKDNPVAGIGIQAVYDNTNSILYFSKKDYDLKPDYVGKVEYVPLVTEGTVVANGIKLTKGQGDYFTLSGKGQYQLGDPLLFDDASWTLSYDPKNEAWISFHDWHPDLVIPTKTVFLTTQKNTAWKHNWKCQHYCNYYGKDYPFEIEYPIITGQSVSIPKSMEYILECYTRADNCVDQFHVLDFNFDNAVLYNSEQVSGYLNLNIFPKNNVTLSLDYPKFNPAVPLNVNGTITGVPGFDILFSKEENKYRFNQFWDITKDRGEFPQGSAYPPQGPLVPGTTELLGNYSQEYIWLTDPNGYTRTLNANNLDHAKPQTQRKKFRHYTNFLTLRKEISGNVNMIFKIANSKNQLSPR